MKKNRLMLFMFLVLFLWNSKIYASCFNKTSFLFAPTTQDLCFRTKIQFLPLYLIFPDLDIRDEENKPIKNYDNLFLDDFFQRYEVFTVWGIFEKKKIIKDIKLRIINLTVLEVVASQNYTKHLSSSYFFEVGNLSLKPEILLC